MRTLHFCYSFSPDPPGGTERYVESLCRELLARGVSASVAAPGARDDAYWLDGLQVYRFAPSAKPNVGALYSSDQIAAARIKEVIRHDAPDVVHQHAFTSACSADVVRSARAAGCATVFTYHTPTVSCLRGTLLEDGSVPCDGRMDAGRCAACFLGGRGLGTAVSRALARVPESVGGWLSTLGLEGGGWTALRMTELAGRYQGEARELFALVDVIVALAPWTLGVLQANGVPEGKVQLVRHGIAGASVQPAPRSRGARCRIAHLGRLDPAKGTEVLVRSLGLIPEAPIDLDIYGVAQSDADRARLDVWRKAAAGDARIRFQPAVPSEEVIPLLATYDLVAVPSQWFETGPLVVLEAFAAGRPVIGSALGGIADKVRDGVDGLLVRPYDSAEAWAKVLATCASEPDLVSSLSAGVSPPRGMAAVAAEMDAVYRRVLSVGSER